jgi:ribosomal protein S13
MFKVGDKVICVDVHRRLTKDKLYEILYIIRNKIFVKDDSGEFIDFDINRFKSIAEYRKIKLQKICSKLEM